MQCLYAGNGTLTPSVNTLKQRVSLPFTSGQEYLELCSVNACAEKEGIYHERFPSRRVIITCSPHRFAVRAATHYHTRAWQTFKHGKECFILLLNGNEILTFIQGLNTVSNVRKMTGNNPNLYKVWSKYLHFSTRSNLPVCPPVCNTFVGSGLCNLQLQQFSFLYIKNFDCSHIEDVHLLFCAHLIIFYYTFLDC